MLKASQKILEKKDIFEGFKSDIQTCKLKKKYGLNQNDISFIC